MDSKQQRSPKLYILVRNDIPLGDQACQACHVNEVWGATMGSLSRINGIGTTVLLSVESEGHLALWKRKIDQSVNMHCEFREPDMSNEITAIACLTDDNIFDGLPMWPYLMPGGKHHLYTPFKSVGYRSDL